MEKVWVDIPSGWHYGWPKVWDRDAQPDFAQWLKDMGCPKELFQLALRYSRMWNYEDNP